MALFGQDQVDPRIAAGGAALGDLAFGGPEERASGVYVDQLKKNYDAADAMWQARDRRNRAIAREGMKAELVKRAMGGDPQAQAELAAFALGTAATPNLTDATGAYKDFGSMELGRQREKAMAEGNVPLYNRLTAVQEDKDYQPARVVSGHVLQDGVGLGAEGYVAQPLPSTQNRMDNDDARTEAQVARANRPPVSRRREMTQAEADATVDFLGQKAKAMVQSGKYSQEYADAWFRAEMAKADMPIVDESDDLAVHAVTPAPQQTGGGAGGAPSVEARPGFVKFADNIPNEARAALKEGVVTRFGNGQAWMLRGGKPVRVK